MRDRLPGVRPGVEDDPVTVAGDPLGLGHLMSVGDDVGQQAVAGRRQIGQVGVVRTRDHEDVDGRLRVDVTEGDRPRRSRHDGRRDVSSGNAAEQTVRHGLILTCGPRDTSQADKVAVLRNPRCTIPLAHWSRQLLAFPRSRLSHARDRAASREWVWGEVQVLMRAGPDPVSSPKIRDDNE
jgi:hypothetical protein